MFTKSLTHRVLISLKRQVTQEESIGRRIGRVAKSSSTGVGTLLWCSVVAGSREINISLTTVNQRTLLGLESSSGIRRIDKLNISETLGSSSRFIADDASTRDLTELLKLTVQPLIINVPAQVTNEQVLGSGIFSSGWGLSLGLLSRWDRFFFGLALLGWSLSFLAVAVGAR